MGVTYPSSSDVEARHRVLLVTLGGASASSGIDLVQRIANHFTRPDSEFYDERVLPVWGHPNPGGQPSWEIARRLRTLVKKMGSTSGGDCRIVLVGKSLGGCRLHRVSRIFAKAEFCLDVNLFVGIDMSCWPARHYQRYVDKGQEYQARVFDNNVEDLLNFYQTKGPFQTGHPALRAGAGFDEDININVNKRPVRIDHHGELIASDAPIAPEANHRTIDESIALVWGIMRIIRAGMTG